MIQKLQTYITRIINWLENNSETRFIRSVLSSNEDIELGKIYKEMNYLNGCLRNYLSKVSEISLNYERSINQAYSHIKRKQKILKLPHSELKDSIGTELSVYSSHDAIVIAERIEKMLDQANRKPHKTQYDTIVEDTAMLSRVVLNIHKNIPTIENSLRALEEAEDA
jgi:hypothetical protein